MHAHRFLAVTSALLVVTAATVRAWDYEAHRVIHQLALAALPTNFPAFVQTPPARERIAFLAGEPDRWRNTPDELSFSHATSPDHYFDVEYLEGVGVTPDTLPIFRHEFAAQLAAARAARPDQFPPINARWNRDRTQESIGYLPWALAENVGRLKSGFSCLNAFEQYGGTPDEIINAQANVIYAMGYLGHFVGDAAQPLHTTKHHHGWLGDNPNDYTRDRGIHQWIDGSYFAQTGGVQAEPLLPRIRPAKLVGATGDAEELFRILTAWLLEQFQQVEPLYQIHKEGKLSGEGALGLQGRAFLEEQLVRAGQMLGDLWFTAWQRAPEDGFLERRLTERRTATAGQPRVLVVTGGHAFERLAFLELFTRLNDATFRVVQHPSAQALFRPEATNQYDVVVLYDMWQPIADRDKTNFLALARSGKGFVVLHHAIANYNTWDAYHDLVGARYYLQPEIVEGRKKARSQYQHDVTFTVNIAAPQHPVTRGLTSFEIRDETYQGFEVAADVQPLLTTTEPSSGPVIGWAKTNGLSRWVYVQLGHDHHAYANPHYRQLVQQAIQWVAGGE